MAVLKFNRVDRRRQAQALFAASGCGVVFCTPDPGAHVARQEDCRGRDKSRGGAAPPRTLPRCLGSGHARPSIAGARRPLCGIAPRPPAQQRRGPRPTIWSRLVARGPACKFAGDGSWRRVGPAPTHEPNLSRTHSVWSSLRGVALSRARCKSFAPVPAKPPAHSKRGSGRLCVRSMHPARRRAAAGGALGPPPLPRLPARLLFVARLPARPAASVRRGRVPCACAGPRLLFVAPFGGARQTSAADMKGPGPPGFISVLFAPLRRRKRRTRVAARPARCWRRRLLGLLRTGPRAAPGVKWGMARRRPRLMYILPPVASRKVTGNFFLQFTSKGAPCGHNLWHVAADLPAPGRKIWFVVVFAEKKLVEKQNRSSTLLSCSCMHGLLTHAQTRLPAPSVPCDALFLVGFSQSFTLWHWLLFVLLRADCHSHTK
ncbi:unnamed protein product [Amoebophrya sp. A120]|nr:unnamed protein product [Amoebophrya sp. A120]|eukprot:GSA120T00019336001.1